MFMAGFHNINPVTLTQKIVLVKIQLLETYEDKSLLNSK